MTRGAMKSIAFMATALLVVLGHRGDAASLLPKHMVSAVENSAGQAQTNKNKRRKTVRGNLLSCSAMSC
jgi:hypothetical protein